MGMQISTGLRGNMKEEGEGICNRGCFTSEAFN